MNSRRFAIAVLALIAPCLYGATTPPAPVVNEGTINYTSNQVTLTGSGFEPRSESPIVLFNGSQLNLVSASDAQIVAKLPSSVVPGTFKVVVKAERKRGSTLPMARLARRDQRDRQDRQDLRGQLDLRGLMVQCCRIQQMAFCPARLSTKPASKDVSAQSF